MDILGFKAAWNDFDNYRDWIKTIKREEADKNSTYNKFNMGKNYFHNIYVILTLPPENKDLPDEILQMRVTESLIPVNRYLDETLKFAEYLTPEFSRVFNNDEPTLSYLAVYRFTFHKLSLSWALWRLSLIGGLTLAAFKIPWQTMGQWISSLI